MNLTATTAETQTQTQSGGWGGVEIGVFIRLFYF